MTFGQNHIGMQGHGRELTVFAQFYRYTGDGDGILLKHFDKIMGRVRKTDGFCIKIEELIVYCF